MLDREKGIMTYMTFERDMVDYLKVGKTEHDGVEGVEADKEDRVCFDLTHRSVVHVSGLKASDRLQVCSLDGKSVQADVSRNDGEAFVDLSQLRSGVYIVSVNGSFTFKLMKP